MNECDVILVAIAAGDRSAKYGDCADHCLLLLRKQAQSPTSATGHRTLRLE